jgi:hypothetical protein
MMDGGRSEPEPPENQGNRNIENVVMLGFFIALVMAGIWLLATTADIRRFRIAPPRDAAIVRRSRFPTGRDRMHFSGMGEARCESC